MTEKFESQLHAHFPFFTRENMIISRINKIFEPEKSWRFYIVTIRFCPGTPTRDSLDEDSQAHSFFRRRFLESDLW